MKEKTMEEKKIMKELRVFMHVNNKFRKPKHWKVCVHFMTLDGRELCLHYDPEKLMFAVSGGAPLFFNKLYKKIYKCSCKLPKETWHTTKQAVKEIGCEPYAGDITEITYCGKVLYARWA